MSSVTKVHVVFKTHLDIGYTDLARNVINTYYTEFIPRALELAEYSRRHTPRSRFIWTTGSWLIYEYFEQADSNQRKVLEEAIMAGDIVWHALPFTTHTELMDASLFRYGLSLSKRLDERFGRVTIAGKMTDVPGHTQAMIPYLAEAGVKFLHIGVNGASYVPEVPGEFLWKHPDGSDIIVIYQTGSYGDTFIIEGFNEVLAFSHSLDNQEPPTLEQVKATFAALHEQFPDVNVMGSTLDAYARALLTIKDTLPVIESEIGDTWIHGIGSDPHKVSQFLALSRWRIRALQTSSELAANSHFDAFSRRLILISEHTWGRDWKKWKEIDGEWVSYVDEDYATPYFLKKLRDGYFAEYEHSWQEQRDYINTALEALNGEPVLQQQAEEVIRKTLPVRARSHEFKPIAEKNRIFTTPFFEIAFDPDSGTIIHLLQKKNNKIWATQDYTWNVLWYEVFGSEDYDRYWEEYIVNKNQNRVWSSPDFTKPGLENTLKKGKRWSTKLITSSYNDTATAQNFLLTYRFDDEACSEYGCPALFSVQMCFLKDRPEVFFDLYWENKQACRIPEAIWFHCRPNDLVTKNLLLKKMETWIHPFSVVKGGNRNLHAASGGLWYQDEMSRFYMTSLDAPLVAPGGPRLLHFDKQLPDLNAGWSFNLYNNIWGTNFPMWYGENARFRFRVDFS